MKLYYLLLFVLVCSCMQSSAASQLSKPFAHFDNCFSLNFSAVQISGNRTPFSFVGCSNPSFNQWSCMCLNDSYDLTLRSENDYSERIFRLNINYSLYNLDWFSQDLIVQDHSNWAEANGDSLFSMNDLWCIPSIKTVYLTKYEDRNISINFTRIIYKDRTINQTFQVNVSEYFENTSTIISLQDKVFSLEDSINRNRYKNDDMFFCLIFITIVCLINMFGRRIK